MYRKTSKRRKNAVRPVLKLVDFISRHFLNYVDAGLFFELNHVLHLSILYSSSYFISKINLVMPETCLKDGLCLKSNTKPIFLFKYEKMLKKNTISNLKIWKHSDEPVQKILLKAVNQAVGMLGAVIMYVGRFSAGLVNVKRQFLEFVSWTIDVF